MVEKLKPFIAFLEENKKLVGLSDYKIFLAVGVENNSSHAEVEADIYENELKISLSEDFFDFDEEKQTNVLLHELIHGKFLIYKKHVNEMISNFEEHFVNDLVRGFERHKKLQLK